MWNVDIEKFKNISVIPAKAGIQARIPERGFLVCEGCPTSYSFSFFVSEAEYLSQLTLFAPVVNILVRKGAR